MEFGECWGNFLKARMDLIMACLEEGRTAEEIIDLIGVGEMQGHMLIINARKQLGN